MWGFKKKPTKNNSQENNRKDLLSNLKIIENEEFFKKFQTEKKGLLPQGELTREEVLKEIEKQIQKQTTKSDNPFRTREDVYYWFWDSNMRINRYDVPFEEVIIGGKSFFINKRFEGGRIIIEEMYGSPDIEINLKEEYDKQNTTKAQLEKITKYILFIKDKISKGDEKYKLLDIEDLKEEKWRLEKILESIKYGKHAIFAFENPYKKKKTYWLRYQNGEYRYMKVTENNYLTEENSIKFIKGYNIRNKLEEVVNLRITKSWKEIAIAVLTILMLVGLLFGLFKLMTFEEELFDKRVQTYCGEQMTFYKQEVEDMKDWRCSLTSAQISNTPVYQQVN